jgi:FkbM family methyltransferase
MIPDLTELMDLAGAVMRRVPSEILSGETAAALYGMGFFGRWAVTAMAREGVRLSYGYDGNPALVGTRIEGLEICSRDRIASDRPEFVFTTARHAVPQVAAMLDGFGIAHVSCDAYFAASRFGRFCEVHDGFVGDERSRRVLRAVLAAMLTGSRAPLAEVFEKDQYFCLPQFAGIEKEIYVDAGAYVGDSIERFVWTHYGVFDRIIAFEPGPRQFAALEIRTQRLKAEWALEDRQIELVPAALGQARARARAESASGQMTSLSLGEGDTEFAIETLDGHLAGRRISFLKADVEGMEMALIEGAAETIRTHRPKIAICVYHYPDDIPVISARLRALVPDYQFALRHHSPQLMETVLYAWTG